MSKRSPWSTLVLLLAVLALVAAACGGDEGGTTTTAAPGDSTTTTSSGGETTTTVSAAGFKFGMILVGPKNDRGWSQAHFEAGEYLQDQLGAEMIVFEKANNADNPGITVSQIAADMIDQGAQLVFATSDDMKDEILLAAEQHPDVPMIWSSGDSAWADGDAYRSDLTNLGNIMGRMEYGKMIAGCAAALTTETGSIAYLGPLINDETRRLANSAYLGARYCYENYRGEDPDALTFTVNWIGFWFNIPGVTLDPTQVANEFFDGGADVVLSGIDTTEAIEEASKRAQAGDDVWAIPYDFVGGCDPAPDVCLGVPYFNWGPAYKDVVEQVVSGTFTATWEWNGPDWSDINNPDTTAVGFVQGPGLNADDQAVLDGFIAGLADGSIELYTGPLNYQDGSEYVAAGATATDEQVWYAKQLLEGMIGPSQ